MARSSFPIQSRYRWRWFLVLFGGLSWLSIGCSPQSLTMFLLPFGDSNKEPEYKLFADGKEINLVILSNFAEKQFQPEIMPAERELADHVADGLRKRCAANKHTLKIVPQAEVRSYQLKLLSEGDASPVEIGKKFKADYVLDLTIGSFSLYQKDSWPKMYRGAAQIAINLYKVKGKDEGTRVFEWIHRTDYTGSRGVPIDAGNSPPGEFRQMFMVRLGRDISRLFIAYSPDELKEWDPRDR